MSAAKLARGLLGALGLCLALAGCDRGQGSDPAEETPPRRPHIVVYMVDTLRADHLGVYGYDRETSPRLDAFASEAIVFERAHSTSSWTRPAVASLLTGLPPARHGATTRAAGIDARAVPLPERLREIGYRTAAFVTNPNVLPVWGFGRGFDSFYDIESVARSARADRVNEVVFEYLARYESEHAAAPLFLYVHTRDPHDPYDPPPPWDTRFEGDPPVAAYDGEIGFNDEQFGKLLDFLKQRGLYDDSIIVFVSDHGEELNERGEFGHGHSLYEELVRIPLIVKLPGAAMGGRRIESVVTLLDIVPTLLGRLGVPLPKDLEGIDLFAGDAAQVHRPVFIDLDLMAARRRNVMSGILMDRQKLVEVREPEPATLLFDLAADPSETRDLSTTDGASLAALRRVLEGERAKSSGGLQLWLVNDGDDPPGRPRVVEGAITASGRMEILRSSEFERGDAFEISEDGRRLRFWLTLLNRRNPIKQPPRLLVDRDGLVISLEPAGAELRIESIRFGGGPADIYLGADAEPAGVAPMGLAANDPALAIPSMATLLRGTRARSTRAAPGVHIAIVSSVRGEKVEISPEIEDRLRALGYME